MQSILPKPKVKITTKIDVVSKARQESLLSVDEFQKESGVLKSKYSDFFKKSTDNQNYTTLEAPN